MDSALKSLIRQALTDFKAERMESAVTRLKTIVRSPLPPQTAADLFRLMGEGQIFLGVSKEAKEAFRKGLLLDPGNELLQISYARNHTPSPPPYHILHLAEQWRKRPGTVELLDIATIAARQNKPRLAVSLARLANARVRRKRGLKKETLIENRLHFQRAASSLNQTLRSKTASMRQSEAAGPKHIFICGFPRSGTTLVESLILTSENTETTGEETVIIDLLRRLENTPQRDVSEKWQGGLRAFTAGAILHKNHNNLEFASAISALLPSARFVIVERDPRDVFISNYLTRYEKDLHMTYQDEALIDAIRSYRAHGHAVHQDLPETTFLLQYEALIRDPDVSLRNLGGFLDMDISQAAERFFMSPRTVKTASRAQIRTPIRTDALERYKAFQPYQPILRRLNTDG